MRARGYVGLLVALLSACSFAPDNPSLRALPDASAAPDLGGRIDVSTTLDVRVDIGTLPDRTTPVDVVALPDADLDACAGAICEGRCVSLVNDPDHCGACGRRCELPGAITGCMAGECTFASCRDGFGNCDGSPINGCEAATSIDVTNCGACGNRCSFANADATCAAGACVMGACAAGFANCDGNATNGCETNVGTGDLANCGACGNACPTPPSGVTALCVGGVCGLGVPVCTSDRANCDGESANGCEVAIFSDVGHCGGCGMRCSDTGGTARCMGGVCAITCSPGLGDCDGDVANGCETSTNTSTTHCGACNRVCAVANATAACVSGACTVGMCDAGYADCDGSVTNGCEVNTAVDESNCGTCGAACPGGQLCSAGVCLANCATGQTGCAGVCRDLATDNTNCGACGRACAGGTFCVAGACVCPVGQTSCSGTCRATQTDNNHCGACGIVCATGQVCSGGVCGTTCASPTVNCSGLCRDRATDPNNCGACGTVCTRANGVAGCASSACTLAACNAGFGNCDGNAANGCEVNTNTTVTNCGVCGNSCQFANAAATCVAGRCTMGACATGFRDCNGSAVDGCEVNVTAGNINHCGACNTRCPTPPVGSIAVCTASTCGTSSVSCAAGTADCNGLPVDMCEVNITTTSNCGACGRACVSTNGTASCTSGLCGITCSTGFGNCNGVLSDGCEINTRTSPTNCGACNNLCALANATSGCTSGVCAIASCNAGFDNCDGMVANGCETNLNSSNTNCGACGTVCGSGTVCSAGVCVSSCGSGQTNCSGTCRNLTADPDACGACGNVCSGTGVASRTCGASACNGVCAAGRANCDGNLQSNGCEVDTNTSVTQCGACTGAACSTSNIAVACSGGNCTGTCNVGFADCDANKRTNGCEINTTNNPNHCGACANVCPLRANASATCVSSACGFACEPGWGNCDGMAANGCEASLTTNGNCGACGTVCSGATPNCILLVEGAGCGL